MMQRSAGGSYVCWRCLSRGLQPKPSLVRRPFSAATSRNLSAFRAHAGVRSFATIQETAAQSNENKNDAAQDSIIEPSETTQTRTLPIRERLREWEAQNRDEAPQPMAFDYGHAGRASNNLTRPRGADQFVLEEVHSGSGAEQRSIEPDSLDLLPPPSTFQPGDLVEYVGSDGRSGLPLLAIYLGYFHGHQHFYATTGKWYPAIDISSRFYFRNFAPVSELQPVIENLPRTDLPLSTLREMSKLDMGPSRIIGAPLLTRLAQFQQKTDQVLQKYATRFEKAHQLVAEKAGDERHLTLEQIRQRLLSKEDLKSPAPAHVLYAVHRTIVSDDVGFRYVGLLGKDSEWLYEITAPEDVTLVQNMQTLVRLFTDIPGHEGTSLSSLSKQQLAQSQLGRFVMKARDAIDASRQSRDWTPHGMLGPAKQHMPKYDVVWTGVDVSILHFLLLWAGYDQFTASSRFHWTGSAILRAIGRYQDTEYLSTTTAWTFLQEIGYLTPWDLHHRFAHRVPGAKLSRESGFAPFQLSTQGIVPYLTEDVFDGKRHDWGRLKAFAIDSQGTVDVDDAVSLEATDVPGQHWVHIHVADPASRIRPQNALAQRASVTPLTLYLPGHYSNIWGVKDEVQKLFSLAPDRICLTFSGLVNDEGQLLEYKITPGKLQEFVYMTPQDANAAVGASRARSHQEKDSGIERFSVGKVPEKLTPNREMTAPSELQAADLESLKTLYRLAEARKQHNIARGAVPIWTPRVDVKAFFDDVSIERRPPDLMICNGDPFIEITWETGSSDMVSTMMVLAGEIASRWSSERNLPIPYLSQPQSVENAELLKKYTQNVYYPLLRNGQEPTNEQWAQLRTLVGPDELSTTPGRHFLMGLDSYTKVTSPLRRYSDLLSHWQIEAALAHEMETGGSAADAKLPFSREELDGDVLPWLRLRQQIISRLAMGAGNEAYMLQALVRAWKFPDASAESKLPDTFRLTVKSAQSTVRAHTHSLLGQLEWFGLEAWLVPQGLGSLGLNVADVRVGDVFEVRLLNVDVHIREVLVEAVRKLSVQKDGDEVEA